MHSAIEMGFVRLVATFIALLIVASIAFGLVFCVWCQWQKLREWRNRRLANGS